MVAAKNVYIRFQEDPIPKNLSDGFVYPLLQLQEYENDKRMVTWALLIQKPSDLGVGKPKTNQLLSELLETLGFEKKEVTSWVLPTGETPGAWDLYVLGENGPWFKVSGKPLFDAGEFLDHVPTDPGGDDKYTILAPADGTDAVTLKDGPHELEALANGNTPKILGFEYVTPDSEFRFKFEKETDSSALPGLTFVCGFNSGLKSAGKPLDFLYTDPFQFKFSCQSASGNLVSPMSVDDSHAAVITDPAKPRLEIGKKALELVKEGNEFKLAFALSAGIRFTHDKLPVELSLGSQNLVCQFKDKDSKEPLVILYRQSGTDTCITLSIVSPMLHAGSASGSFSSTLPLLEPFQAQAAGKVTVEDDNDLLAFATTFCFKSEVPETPLLEFTGPNLDFPQELMKWLGLVKKVEFPDIGLPKFNWVIVKKAKRLSQFIIEIDEPLPDFGLSGSSVPSWKLSFKLPDGSVHFRRIKEFSDAFKKVHLSESLDFTLPDSFELGFHCQYRSKAALDNSITLDLKGFIKKDGFDLLDMSQLKLRVRQVSTGHIRFRRVKSFEMDVGDFPKFTVDTPWGSPLPSGPDFEVDIFQDWTQPLMAGFLDGLLGDLAPVEFMFSVPHTDTFNLEGWDLSKPVLPIPFEMRLIFPGLETAKYSLDLWVSIALDLKTFRLAANRLYFYLPALRPMETATAIAPQCIDMDIFTLVFHARAKIEHPPNENDHDGYLDLEKRELVIDFKVPLGLLGPQPKIRLFFPGGLTIEDIMELEKGEISKTAEPPKGANRFTLELEKFNPSSWPTEEGADNQKLAFRLSPQGVTFRAEISKNEVLVDGSEDLVKDFKFQPQEAQGRFKSRIIIIDNQIREAAVYATTFVPGVEKLLALIGVSLRQPKPGVIPDVIAEIRLEKADDSPIAELSMGFLQMKLKRLKLGLAWLRSKHGWDYQAIADGSISFTGAANLIPDLGGLRAPNAIEVIGLDLRNLNIKELKVPLKLAKPARFEMLSGQFVVELGDLELAWVFDGKLPRPTLLSCALAKFTFKNPGVLDVSIGVGGLHIEFDRSFHVKIALPSRLSIEANVSKAVGFLGDVGWVDDAVTKERYFFASGRLSLEGMPEVEALLKIGTGVKFNGQTTLNFAIYGGMDLDTEVFPGVVVKSLGVGMGINNRLALISARPNVDEMLQRIDLMDPARIDAWKFVREDGLYVSVVAKTFLASTQGKPDVPQAYVAMLVLSLDTNFDLIAAGKFWVSSSLKGVKDNLNRPLLVGAVLMSLRNQKVEMALESRPNPFIENNPFLQKLMGNVSFRFSFRLAPGLVDYYLERISYSENFLGATFLITGSYRVAIFRRTLLVRAGLSAIGSVSKELSCGCGGFSFEGALLVDAGYGGLLSEDGALFYAYLEASLSFSVSAWIEIGFSKSFKICGKKITIEWSITFKARAPSLELRLRGQIGMKYEGGTAAVGFSASLGIDYNICGYRLNFAGQIEDRPEVFQEVLDRVTAFEKELDKFLASDKRSFAALAAVEEPALLDSMAVRLASAAARTRQGEVVEEAWLHYVRSQKEGESPYHHHVLIPDSSAPWFTPVHADITHIQAVDEKEEPKLRLRVWSPSHGLTKDHVGKVKIATVGIRGYFDEKDEWVFSYKANGSWDLVGVDLGGAGTLDLKLESKEGFPDQAQTEVFGGAWYVQSYDDNPVPHLVNDVQAIGVGYGDAIDIKAVVIQAGKVLITTEKEHKLDKDSRVLVCKETQIFAPDAENFEPGSPSTIRPHLTWSIELPTDPTDKTHLTLRHCTKLGALAAGWKVCRSKEVWTPWNAENLGRLRGGATKLLEEDEISGGNDNILGKETYRALRDLAPMFVESSRPSSQPVAELPDHSSYLVAADPRIPNTSRDLWNLEARYKNPDYAIPYDFRPTEQLAQEGVSAGNLQEIVEYEKLVQLARQAAMHRGLDLEDAEQLHRSQAVLAHLITDDLSAAQGPERFGEVKLGNDAPAEIADLAVGLIFTIPKENWPQTVFVRRTGGQLASVTVTDPDSVENPIDFIQRFPIRQAFVVQDQGTNAPDAKEQAKVVVKLPIGIHPDLIRKSPASLGHFQIFRQFPWEEKPVLRRDFVRPDVTFLEGPRVVERGLCELLNEGGIKLKLDPETSELNGSSPEGLHVVVQGVTARGKDHPLTTKILNHDKQTITIDADVENLGALLNQPFAYAIVEQGKILVNPYVFTDEYPVENRQFSDKALVTKGLRPGETEILYSLRFVPHGEHETVEDPTSTSDGRYGGWGPVRLHIPELEDFPKNLAVVLPVDSLIHKSSSKDLGDQPFGVLELVAMKDGVPHKPIIRGRALGCDDFELWAQQLPLRQTGFYAGAEPAPAEPKAADSSTVRLKDVDPEQLHESADHKIKVQLKQLNDGRWQIFNTGDFPSGFGYRLFIRSSKYAEINLLTPLPCFLVREIPKEWSESVRMRPVEQVEFFSDQLARNVWKNEAVMLDATEFSVDDLFEEGSNRLRVTWESQSLLDGGMELVFRDEDDSSLVRRQMCEVVEALQYCMSRRDFSGASIWTLSPDDRRERVPDRGDAPKPKSSDLTEHFYSKDAAAEGVLNALKGAFQGLYTKILDPLLPQKDYDWKDDLVPAAQRFTAAVLNFLRSPLNLNDPQVTDAASAMLLYVRALVIGLQVPELKDLPTPGNSGILVRDLKQRWVDMRSLLETIDKLDQTGNSSDAEGEHRFLDADFAKTFASLVRRRNAVADDVLGLVDEKTIPDPDKDQSKSRKDPCPRQGKWDDLEKEVRSFTFQFPNTEKLLAMVSRKNLSVAAQNMSKLYCNKEGHQTKPAANSFSALIEDQTKLAKLLPRASSLAAFLRKLEGNHKGERLTVVKRPHHELMTGADAQGTTIPLPTPIRNYMPDEARAHKPEDLPPLPSTGFIQSGNRVARLVTVAKEDDFHRIRIWATRGELGNQPPVLMQTLDEPASSEVRSVDVTHSGVNHLLFVCLGDGHVSVWDILRGERLVERAEGIDAAIFAETPKGLSILCAKGEFVEERDPFKSDQWRLISPSKPLTTFKQPKPKQDEPPEEIISSLAYDPKKHVLVAGTKSGLALMWRYGDPLTPYRRLAHHTWKVMVKDKDQFALVSDSVGNGEYQTGTGEWKHTEDAQKSGKVEDATWAAPIVIRSKDHRLKDFDAIKIEGVNGNEASNGNWVVRVIDPGSFEILEASAGTGNYTKGGRIWPPGSARPSEINITGATNASPIFITAIGHQFRTGDRVSVDGVEGNLAANSFREVPVSVKIAPMPHGRRVVTAGKEPGKDTKKDAVRIWHVPDTRAATLVFAASAESDESISSVAFDAKGVQLAVGTDKGRALVWSDFTKLEASVYGPKAAVGLGATSVSFAHKGEDVYLFTSYSTKEAYLWRLSGTAEKDPPPVVHEGDVSTVTAAHMPQVTATAARHVVAYFNLLERLGFALDIAIVDGKNQVLQRKALEAEVKPVLEQILDEDHYVALLLGEEPDAEFDPKDVLGFSFVKVAVVPKDFHHLCLRAKPILGRVPMDPKCTDTTIVLDERTRNLKLDDREYVVAIVKGKGKGKSRKISAHNAGDAKATIEGPWSALNDPDIPDETSEYIIADMSKNSVYTQLIHWFDFRGIKLDPDLYAKAEGDSVSIGSSNPLVPREHIMAEPLIYLMHVREMAQYGGLRHPDSPKVVEIHVQPRVERWLTVPAVGRRSHSAWTVPDRKGYRFKAAVRRVSRYEPLLQWAAGLRKPVPVPKEQAVLDGTVATTAPQGSWKLSLGKPLSGWDGVTPLRVEITEGAGAGQHRAIKAVEGDNPTVVIDQGDPWLAEIKEGAAYRIMGEADYWTPISVPPVLDPLRGEGSKALTVYTYPHPSRVMFSYQLPAEGARSIYNQISAIRTGYKGTDLVFRYDLVDRDPVDPQNLVRLLEAMKKIDNPNEAERPRRLAPVQNNNEASIRLFRHERMVSLPDLPFFYRYRMDARSLFATRPVDTVELQPSEFLPLDPDRSPSAERGPSQLSLSQPTIAVTGGQWSGTCGKRDGLNKQQVTLKPDGWPVDWNQVWIKDPVTNPEPTLMRLTVTKRDGSAEKATSYVTTIEDKVPTDGLVRVSVDRPWESLPDTEWDYLLELIEYEITIYASRNRDHLTQAEADAQPHPLSVEFRPFGVDESLRLPAGEFPDFAMDYGLFWQMRDQSNPLYVLAGWVRMPWSKEYPAPPMRGMNNQQWPFVEVCKGLSLSMNPAVESKRPVQMEYFDPAEGAGVASSDRRVYRVRFPLRALQGSTYYKEPSKFYLQGFRNKISSKEIQFKELADE